MNTVSHNEIYYPCGQLNDCGGIYMLGTQPGL